MFTQRKHPANAFRLALRLVLIPCLVGAQLTQAMGQRVRNRLADKGPSPHVNRVVNKEPYACVDPLIGTARGKQGYGQVNSAQTFPAVGLPFGTTQWTPQTEDGEATTLVIFSRGPV